MHVPDGFINAPVSAATGLISLGTIWAYIRNAKNLVADRLIALTGMMSALIFVLQMINFPIAAGTSGHLLGGALAVIVLGPSLGDNYPQFIKTLSKSLSKFTPRLRVPSSANKRNLSTDEQVVKDYFDDPLVFRSITARFGGETIESQNFVNDNINNLKTNTLYLHGDGDTIVPISSGENLSKLPNVKFVTVRNSKHEILNQDTRPFVLSEIHSWLKENSLV